MEGWTESQDPWPARLPRRRRWRGRGVPRGYAFVTGASGSLSFTCSNSRATEVHVDLAHTHPRQGQFPSGGLPVCPERPQLCLHFSRLAISIAGNALLVPARSTSPSAPVADHHHQVLHLRRRDLDLGPKSDCP